MKFLQLFTQKPTPSLDGLCKQAQFQYLQTSLPGAISESMKDIIPCCLSDPGQKIETYFWNYCGPFVSLVSPVFFLFLLVSHAQTVPCVIHSSAVPFLNAAF